MSGSHDDMDDIVQSFVHTDLASLDRIGGEPESFTLSPHLTEQSPSLQQQSPQHPASAFTSAAASKSAREGPDLAARQPPTRAAHDLPQTPEEEEPAGGAGPAVPAAPPTQEPAAATAARPGPASRQPSASGHSSVRNVSTSSTASVSTQEREKRASSSLGDKFKMFGKRITSGGSKK